MREKIILLFNTSEEYVNATYVALHSIIRKGGENTFKVYIFCSSDVTDSSEQELYSMQLIFSNLEICIVRNLEDDINIGNELFDRIPNVAYSRLFAPKYIYEDKCLYLDQDIFVTGDIYELYSFPIEKYVIAGVTDLSAKKHIYDLSVKASSYVDGMDIYINAGVVLMNLANMRNTNWLDSVKYFISLNLPMGDEDCLNIAAKGKVLSLPEKFNIQQGKNLAQNEEFYIIHYSGNRKPWNNLNVPLAKSWWYDCQQTIIFDDFLQKAGLAMYNSFMNTETNLLKDNLCFFQKKNIWIFGAGKLGNKLLKMLENYGISVNGFIVTDLKKQSIFEIDGVPVFSYISVPDKENAFVLVSSSRDWALICDMLYHSGFKNVYDATYLINYYEG